MCHDNLRKHQDHVIVSGFQIPFLQNTELILLAFVVWYQSPGAGARAAVQRQKTRKCNTHPWQLRVFAFGRQSVLQFGGVETDGGRRKDPPLPLVPHALLLR